MNRATLFYVVTLLGCAAGMWAVLAVGAGLSAPTDLSGRWVVVADASAASDALLGKRATVSQSGRFLHFEFDGGLVLDLKMVEEQNPAREGDPARVTLEDGSRRMTLAGTAPDGPLHVTLVQPDGTSSFRLDRPAAD